MMIEQQASQTHDYTKRSWGHDYTITQVYDGGQRLRLVGWGRGIKAGDYLLLENDGASTRYQVATVDYYSDPPDMWRMEATFAPRPMKESA